MPAVDLVCGTVKGAFIFRSDEARQTWTPLEEIPFRGWKVTAAARDAGGRTYLGTASWVYGATVQVTDDPDLTDGWRQIEDGPAWPEGGERQMKQIWRIRPDETTEGRVWAGVDEAGLFRSDDRGETWRPVEGLNDHPSREAWIPGLGGLCAHAILVDPDDPDRIWCGISAVGVFRSEDGGATWTACNEGVERVMDDVDHDDVGFCVHGLAADPGDADTIWRQEHRGMFRTRDGGETWTRIEDGLPSSFGFPCEVDRPTGTVYTLPLESDEYRMPPGGALTVYRSLDGGDTWEALTDGLPRTDHWTGALRGAMAVDELDPCGVYFGTTSGTVHVSTDAGDSWRALDATLPRVLWVSAFPRES